MSPQVEGVGVMLKANSKDYWPKDKCGLVKMVMLGLEEKLIWRIQKALSRGHGGAMMKLDTLRKQKRKSKKSCLIVVMCLTHRNLRD